MKLNELTKRLVRDRPMVSVTLRMPIDVVEDLKRVAPMLGMSGYQSLIRAYVGNALRLDIERLDDAPIARLVEALKRQGVATEAIDRAFLDAQSDESAAHA